MFVVKLPCFRWFPSAGWPYLCKGNVCCSSRWAPERRIKYAKVPKGPWSTEELSCHWRCRWCKYPIQTRNQLSLISRKTCDWIHLEKVFFLPHYHFSEFWWYSTGRDVVDDHRWGILGRAWVPWTHNVSKAIVDLVDHPQFYHKWAKPSQYVGLFLLYLHCYKGNIRSSLYMGSFRSGFLRPGTHLPIPPLPRGSRHLPALLPPSAARIGHANPNSKDAIRQEVWRSLGGSWHPNPLKPTGCHPQQEGYG